MAMTADDEGTPLDTRVFGCPRCGAPLPRAKDGEDVTCAFCHEATKVVFEGAMLEREQASRREAEKLFAEIGPPPSTSQRIAVALVNPWLWLLGAPFLVSLFIVVGRLLMGWIGKLWELFTHERLLHVLPPRVAFALSFGITALLPAAILIWSLFGERVSARRELQAALAAKPPSTEGGRAACRVCGAPLDFEPGALGRRCAHCGADNLVAIPASWAAKAKRIEADLRLTMATVTARRAESRRRVRRAAMWRLPFVAGLTGIVVYLGLHSGLVSFGELAYDASRGAGLFRLAEWHPDYLGRTVQLFAACDAPNPPKDSLVGPARSGYQTAGTWQTHLAVPLRRGERLQLRWERPGEVEVEVVVENAEGVGLPSFAPLSGDPIASKTLAPAEPIALDVLAPTTAFYDVELVGDREATLRLCVVP